MSRAFEVGTTLAGRFTLMGGGMAPKTFRVHVPTSDSTRLSPRMWQAGEQTWERKNSSKPWQPKSARPYDNRRECSWGSVKRLPTPCRSTTISCPPVAWNVK